MAIHKSDFFGAEIALLADTRKQEFVRWFFEAKCPKWFFESAASSSGKYHPDFVQGFGGLVRHCKAVAQMAAELCRNPIFGNDPKDEVFQDLVIIAAMTHDCAKFGMTDVYEPWAYKHHEVHGAELVAMAWEEFFSEDCPEILYDSIYTHMGTWTSSADREPSAPHEKIVALADYVTSRKMVNVPGIAADWEEVNNDLPFYFGEE